LSEVAKRLFVLTGGPGSGKSTLIQALRTSGYLCLDEGGRGIIRDQVAIGGRALPWHDTALFAELMLSWDMRSYRIAEQSVGPVFFDRGVVDVAAYFRLIGVSPPTHVERAVEVFRYNPRVLIAPPWQEIYAQDRERKQDFEEALRTYEALVATYTECGYELIQLPRETVEERMHFVLESIGIAR
jgi:predicted ATPase